MPRVGKGSEAEKNGNWYARIRWTEESGKRKDLWIPAKNKSRLRACAPDNTEGLVFGIVSTVKKSFASACKAAGVDGFRLHDCRHTAITRLIQAGIPPIEVMKISGHTQHVTFARYVNRDAGAIRRAAGALTSYNERAGAQEVANTVN